MSIVLVIVVFVVFVVVIVVVVVITSNTVFVYPNKEMKRTGSSPTCNVWTGT